MAFIPYGRQNITNADIAAVTEVLTSDFITQGPAVPAFENAVKKYCNAQHAIATNSATSALHIACLALGLGEGDIVWTSPVSFVASANCAVYCGARVDFVDIDPRTYNLSVTSLRKKLEYAVQVNQLPKVVIPVHLSGQSCEMAEIHALSAEFGFKIIEDASHAIGGRYKDKPVGSCAFSDITVFSFHPVKIITTAEGGLATTNDRELARKMALLRSHHITRDANEMSQEPDGPWYYEQTGLGLNYRMTDIQAALGVSQMNRLDEFIEKRQVIANRYNDKLSNLPITLPFQHPDSVSAWHLYIIRLPLGNSLSHLDAFEQLRRAGIGVNVHYIPIYKQPYYKVLNIKESSFVNSESYYKEAISIPMFADLGVEQQLKVIDEISKLFKN